MEHPDIDLLRQAQAGREEAFHSLIERHAPGLLRLARTQVPTLQDAEDLVQETFLGAFRSLGSFQERSSVKTWLYAILFRQAAVLRRKLRLPLRMMPEDMPLSGPPPAAQVDARLDVASALEKLPEEYRAVLLLRELDGLSYEEIAQLLMVPRGTVESRLFRARQALREWLLPRQD